MNPDGVRGAGRLTKSGFKSIIASILIIAMLLSTMGGATYSWFSDSDISSVEVGTGTVDYSISVNPKCIEKTVGSSQYKVVSQIDVTYSNNGTLPIKVNPSFRLDVFGVISGRSMDYYYWHHNNENGKEIFKKLDGIDLNPLEPIQIIVTIGDTVSTINFEKIDTDISKKIDVGENGSPRETATKRIQWEPKTIIESVELGVGANGVTRSYQISFESTDDIVLMNGIPLQFYTVGFQPDYKDHKQSTTDTTGISHEEKPIEASIRQIEESAEVDLDPHSESPSDSKWIPEADVFDSAIIGKEEESDPRSAQYAQSFINRHSGSDADAPKAVAP